jgi:hypothetical protein
MSYIFMGLASLSFWLVVKPRCFAPSHVFARPLVVGNKSLFQFGLRWGSILEFLVPLLLSPQEPLAPVSARNFCTIPTGQR